MVSIYFVRHCEAEGNKMKIFQGTTDCDISDRGARQLEFLKERFRDVHIDRAYSSPLTRAYKTALAAVEGKGLEVIKDKGFIEIDGGVIEGLPFAKSFADYPELGRIWVEELQNFAPEGGESIRQVYERAKNAFLRVANDPENEGKTLLIASHGAVTKCLLCYLIFGDVERIAEIPWSSNTSVSLINYNNGVATVEYFNDDSHIPEEFMPADARNVNNLWKKED